MNTITKRVAGATATAAMLLNAFTPVLAGQIVITGNGAGSDSFATVSQSSTTAVSQNNNANVNNNIDSNATTGYNSASFNTGGLTAIGTGDAENTVSVSNNLNSNAADVDCCDTSGFDVEIDGNGAFSNNIVDLDNANIVSLAQNNDADVDNDIDADATTGHNKAYANTGGDVLVSTGKAKNTVSVSTTANTNVAHVGNEAGSDNPDVSLKIVGNGAFSSNFIDADLSKVTAVSQNNDADVDNDVDADADTGFNKSDFNTGGDVLTHTGDAMNGVQVLNNVNFNHATVDCGCSYDLLAKIEGNGASLPYYGYDNEWGHSNFSPYFLDLDFDDNVIEVDLASAQTYAQNNDADLDNDLEDSDATTGHNQNSSNTAEAGDDPAVVTGDAMNSTYVENNGNVNTIGEPFHMDWPWGDTDVEMSFNFGALMALFGYFQS